MGVEAAAGAMSTDAPKKKTKKKAAAGEDWEEEWNEGDDWGEEAWEEEAPKPKKKKAKVAETKKVAEPEITGPAPYIEDLEPGTVVIFWDDRRGVVRDAFLAIDEFWVADEETGQVVKDDNGDIIQFKSAQLQLVAPPPIALPKPPEESKGAWGGVLLMGGEDHMMQLLQHFGSPDETERQTPQQLLAIPCPMCDPNQLLPVATEGIDPGVRDLAKKMRPDIHVAFRAYHFKQAMEQLGADLVRMEGLYCLASVNLPFSAADIEAVDGWERHWREEVSNQIDLCVTSNGCWPEELTGQAAAKRAIGEYCGIALSDVIWADNVQQGLRRSIGASSIPLCFTDANEAQIYVIVIPDDAEIEEKDGILCFSEGPTDYATLEDPSQAELAEPVGTVTDPIKAKPEEQARRAGGAGGAPKDASKPLGKTVSEWEDEQKEFSGQPKLPPGWIRCKSSKTGEVYYFNKTTKESTFQTPEQPLPEGWTKQVSKSTGKTYYFHARLKKSSYERPTA